MGEGLVVCRCSSCKVVPIRGACPTYHPSADIVALAKKYDAVTFIDECHATGFFGETGRGTDEYHGVRGEVRVSVGGEAEEGRVATCSTRPRACLGFRWGGRGDLQPTLFSFPARPDRHN